MTNFFLLLLGTNAKLKYSIEKNVIDEHTGTPIFEIEEETGVIKTAVCCLDREKTPDYSIQGNNKRIYITFIIYKLYFNNLDYQPRRVYRRVTDRLFVCVGSL